MAFVNPNDENANPITPAPISAGPVSAGGQGGAGQKGVSPAAATPGINVPQAPSAALSNYLAANVNQANNFGGQVANTLGQQTAAAGNAINPAVNTYTGALTNVAPNTTINNEVQNAPSTLSAADQAAYQQELSAAGNAPNSANTFESSAGYAGLVPAIQNAVTQEGLWNSGNNVANLQTAVQPFEAPNASSGVSALDSLLLSQTPGAYNQIQNAVAPAGNLQNQLSAATTGADTSLQNAIQNDQAATTGAQNAATTFGSNLTNQLNTQTAAAQAAANGANTQAVTDLQAGNVTAADAAALGLTPAQATALNQQYAATTADITKAGLGSPITLQDFLNQAGAGTITQQNIATPEDYANVAAINALLGSAAPSTPLTAATANQAGTAPTNIGTLNLGGAQNALSIGDQIAQLQQDAEAKQAYGTYLMGQWNANHFGGQNADQMNSYINSSVNAPIAADNAKIKALAGETLTGTGNVSAPGGLPVNWQNVGNFVANNAGNIGTALGDIGSTIGNWFSEGGMVPKKPKKFKDFMEGK